MTTWAPKPRPFSFTTPTTTTTTTFTSTTHTLQVPGPVPRIEITPPCDVVTIDDVTPLRDLEATGDVTTPRDVVAVVTTRTTVSAVDAPTRKDASEHHDLNHLHHHHHHNHNHNLHLPSQRDEPKVERVPGLKKSRLYKVCQGVHAACFLVHMVAFSMAYWRTYTLLSPPERQQQELEDKEEADVGDASGVWGRAWESRVMVREGLWRRCLGSLLEERFRCPQRVADSELGLVIQVAEGVSMGLITLGLLLTIYQVCCTAVASHNALVVSCTCIGGAVGAVGSGLFVMEQFDLEQKEHVHELALGWAFYASGATSALFFLTGLVLYLDQFCQPLHGYLLAKPSAEEDACSGSDGSSSSSSDRSGEVGDCCRAGPSSGVDVGVGEGGAGVGEGGGRTVRSSESCREDCESLKGLLKSGRGHNSCHGGHGGSGRDRMRGHDNPVFVGDEQNGDITTSFTVAAVTTTIDNCDDGEGTRTVTRL